ncbi:MAG TPA: winged helix-turn-helix domain-containing protein [Iamia sp.]
MTDRRAAPPPVPSPGAEILQWPADAERRDALCRAGVPRLLVLEAGQVPPAPVDDLEDWIWLPADERDLFSRLRDLAGRGARTALAPGAIAVGEDGMAWIAGHLLPLPPAEAAILRLLADPPERLCTREELHEAAWAGVPHVRRSLDSRIFVLRRRLVPHGLAIHAVRGRGFVLTVPSRGSGP